MLERSISFTKGPGVISHNARDFLTDNVDKDRVQNNIQYCHGKIEDAYQKLFGEALEKYNAKQTRKDRIVENYYEKIRTGKQEKTFHEVIVQIGDKDNMGAKTEYGQLAGKILDEYMKGFAERNPYLHVFSAHLHMDEASPHLHIDFIPFTTGSKRGLETRVSLKAALEKQGFKGGTRSCTELNEWYEAEKVALSKIMLQYGVKWVEKHTHEKHKSVSEFKKQKLIEEVEALEEKKEDIERKIATYQSAEDYSDAMAAKMTSGEYKIPEPPNLMSAKSYHSKFVEPLIKKLVNIIKTLARKCYVAEKEAEQATSKLLTVHEEKERLKSANWDLRMANSQMGVEVRNFEKIKNFLGVDKVKEMLKIINAQKHKTKQKKQSEPER